MTMDNLRAVSLNVRGIRNGLKRRKIFRFLKKLNANVIMLQETHSENKDINIWSSEWGYKGIFAHGTRESGGTLVFVKKEVNAYITDKLIDPMGRYVIFKTQKDDYTMTYCNIYAPNRDDPQFFRDVFEKVRQLDSTYIILGGDFNVVREARDRSCMKIYHKESHNVISSFMEENNLVDIWRCKNPDSKTFTWVKNDRGIIWSRIDYFLISQGLQGKIEQCTISPGILTDHSLVSIEINSDTPKRGPGLWRFNNKHLDNNEFVDKMRKEIERTKYQSRFLNKIDAWELIKFQATQLAREFGRQIGLAKEERKFNLYKLLGNMQDDLIENPADPSLRLNIPRVRAELDSYLEEEAKSSAFRCRANYFEMGERTTSYFLNMEKRNFVNKTMYRISKSDGSITKDYAEVLHEQWQFYNTLYTSDSRITFSLVNDTGICLSNEQKLYLEQDISKEELFDAVMTLKNNKAPGGDGLTIEFYRKFWKELIDPLFEMYSSCLDKGVLNKTARRGIISLIPKKSRDLLNLKHWRPLTLLCNDMKILAKLVSNRLDLIMEFLIGSQQVGFVKNRSIHCNIRTTMEVISYLNKKGRPGVIAMIDFEKCFDRIEHNAIKGAMRYFNFGKKFIQLTFLMFNKLELFTQSNGFFSEVIYKTRGINQGDPQSPGIYLLCSECMAHLLKNQLKGISINGIKNILSQFADDTGVYLSYEPLEIDNFCKILQHIETNTGLKVSYEKTSMYRVGSLAHTNAMLYTCKDLRWTNENIDTLGVKLSITGEIVNQNFDDVIAKMRSVASNWYNRGLTLIGKIVVINTLLTSLFVYKMTVMCDLSETQLKQANGIIHDFIWKGKKAKISARTLTKPYEDGGLKLTDLLAKQKSLHIAWIFRTKPPFLQECMYSALSTELRELFWKCNLNCKDAKRIFNGNNNLWHSVAQAWAELNFCNPGTKADVLDELIWFNSNIRICNEPICWSNWINKNVLFISDLYDTNMNEFVNTFNMPWLEFRQITSAIPIMYRELLKQDQMGETHPKLYNKLLNTSKISSFCYNELVKDHDQLIKYCRSWYEEIPNFDLSYDDYRKRFRELHTTVKIAKYKDFQYRLLLNKIVTGDKLFLWGIIDSDSCKLCNTGTETVLHLFFHCKYAQMIIKFISEICDNNNIEIEINPLKFILGNIHENPNHVINFICIVLKQFLYRHRCQGSTFHQNQVKTETDHLHDIEYFIHKRNNRLYQHIKKWSPVYPHLLLINREQY